MGKSAEHLDIASRAEKEMNIFYHPGVEYARIGPVSLTMNLFVPEVPEVNCPVILWLHGGGMRQRHYFTYGPPILCMLERGFAVVQVTYRVVIDDASVSQALLLFPAQIQDVKTAVRFLRKNADNYRLDTGRIGVAGDSAGGQLSALMALTSHVEEFEGSLYPGYSSKIKAACDFYGPTEFLTMDEDAKTGPPSAIPHDAPDSPESMVCGGPIQLNRRKAILASPMTYTKAYIQDAAPLLIFHGNLDRNVSYLQSVRLFEALRAGGADVTFHLMKGKDHSMFWFPEIRPIFIDFFDKKLK